MPTATAGDVAVDVGIDELEQIWEMPTPSWKVLVHDDDVNTMDYVVAVFMKHFKLQAEDAMRHMMEVHLEGKSALAAGERDAMLAHKVAMNDYGLQATVESD